MDDDSQTFENNGRQIQEELIDPGRDPRTVQGETAAKHALRVSTPARITRKDRK